MSGYLLFLQVLFQLKIWYQPRFLSYLKAIFYERLLEFGWPFFYKVILAFLQQFETMLLEKSDLACILTILKSQNHVIKHSASNKNPLSINWSELFQKADKMQIDTNFIYKMHSSFDVQNQWYKTTN